MFLPPLRVVGSPPSERKCGCEYQVCENAACQSSGDHLDGAGNHALICHPGVKAQKATILEAALEKSFRKAGGDPKRQPSTYSLLGGFFTKEDLSRLFPGRLSSKESAKRCQLAMRYLDILRDIPRGSMRTGLLGALRELDFPSPSVAGEEDNNGFLRFDMRFPSVKPIDRPKEIWFDHAIVQETSQSYAADVLKFLQASDGNKPAGSVAFTKMYRSKTRRYAALQTVAERLNQERKLAFQPQFLYPIVSSLGFFNEDFQKLMKCMGQQFESSLPETPRLDGLTPGVLKGRFKIELKNSICFALVKGNALAMHNQGRVGVTCAG